MSNRGRRMFLIFVVVSIMSAFTISGIIRNNQKVEKPVCTTVQGHIERIVYLKDSSIVSLVEVPNHIFISSVGHRDLSAFTMRMLMAGDGSFVEICSVPDHGIYQRVVSGRILIGPTPTP